MGLLYRFTPLIVVCLYFLSGVTALAYEVLWAKMLGLVFGTSIFGVVITIAAFMAGLGCGSSAGFYALKKIRRPLLVFALIEIGIGIFAFNLPALVSTTDAGLEQLSQEFAFTAWFGLQALFFFMVLFVPAFAMGFGFPVILEVLRGSSFKLATIYGVNTLGGVIGALVPLALLPVFGWTASERLIAILSIIIGLVALVLVFGAPQKDAKPVGKKSTIHWPSVLAYAAIGAAALMLQVAWTRLYGMLLLRTEYVMAIILASFLVGIGLGSYMAGWMKQRYWLMLLPILAALFSSASLWMLPVLAYWAESMEFYSLLDAMLGQSGLIIMVTLPATLMFGAWLPILTKHYGDGHGQGALYYASNSIGAALGALLAGVVITPALGSSAVAVIAIVLILLAGLVWVRRRIYLGAGFVVILISLPVAMLPPVNRLLPISQAESQDLAVYEDALGITHVIEQPDGTRLLLADLHRMDASSELTAVAVQQNQARLPLLLSHEPDAILFLGLGTGITASASLAVDTIQRTAVELSRGAINAAQMAFRPVNLAVLDHMEVLRDDARRFLKVDKRRFDIIVGDLFHPDLIGRSALLSTQQFERVRAHLTEKGIFVQWLALNQFDLYSLQVILRTFRQVFPEAVLFLDGFRLALVGGNARPLISAQTVFHQLASLPKDRAAFLSGGEGAWTWIGRFLGPIPEASVPVQDEWAPVIEFSLPAARYQDRVKLEEVVSYLLRQRPAPEALARRLALDEVDYAQFESAYMATSLILTSWLADMAGDGKRAEQFLRMAYQANPQDRWIGFTLADRLYAGIDQAVRAGRNREEMLRRVLEIRSDHLDSLKDLWRLAKAAGRKNDAAMYARRILELNPLDKEVRK